MTGQSAAVGNFAEYVRKNGVFTKVLRLRSKSGWLINESVKQGGTKVRPGIGVP